MALHKQLQIIITVANQQFYIYIPSLILVGIVLCTDPLYILIKLMSRIHWIILIGCILFFPAVAIISCFLLTISGRIESEGETFLCKWKMRQKSRFENMQLQAAFPLPLHIKNGPLSYINRGAIFTVFNIILNYLVTFILII